MIRALGTARTTPRLTWLVLAGCILATALIAAGYTTHAAHATPSSARSAAGGSTLTVYSQTKKQQYLNHADDRARGVGSDPFGHYGDSTATAKQGGDGPFPGDEAYFQFWLYKDAALTHRVGSSVLVCRYDFDKNAYCDAAFQFGDGNDLIASGAFSFSAKEFTLAVTGGTGTYRGMTGVVNVTGGSGDVHTQRVQFDIS